MFRGRAFVLLAVVCLPFWVGYGLVQWQQHEVRETVRERMVQGLDREELVLLTFTAEQVQTELYWEHDREFEYHGEMYDVVETEHRGDTVYYWCWWDRHESQLNHQLRTWVAQALGQDPYHQEHRVSVWLLAQHVFPPASFSWETHPCASYTAVGDMPYRAQLLERTDQPPVPPPRSVEYILSEELFGA